MAPGKDPKDPAQAQALRELLRVLRLSSKEAAERAGLTERDVANLCAGYARLAGQKTRWDERAQRWIGPFAEFAESMFVKPGHTK